MHHCASDLIWHAQTHLYRLTQLCCVTARASWHVSWIDSETDEADIGGVTCREVTVEISLMRPSSSFRLYPSGRLSLSLTFHNLMVLSEKNNTQKKRKRGKNAAINIQTGLRKAFFYEWGASFTLLCGIQEYLGCLTICGEEEVCSILLRQPSDLIDLLLNLQTLKVIKLRLMALECAVDIVLSLGEWLSLSLRKERCTWI